MQPGLVTFYDTGPGNRAGLFFPPWSLRRAISAAKSRLIPKSRMALCCTVKPGEFVGSVSRDCAARDSRSSDVYTETHSSLSAGCDKPSVGHHATAVTQPQCKQQSNINTNKNLKKKQYSIIHCLSNGHFPGESGLASCIAAKDNGSGGDNWSYEMCKAPVK